MLSGLLATRNFSSSPLSQTLGLQSFRENLLKDRASASANHFQQRLNKNINQAFRTCTLTEATRNKTHASQSGSILSWSRSQLAEFSLDFSVPYYSSRPHPGRRWAAEKPMELPGGEVTVEEDEAVAVPAAC